MPFKKLWKICLDQFYMEFQIEKAGQKSPGIKGKKSKQELMTTLGQTNFHQQNQVTEVAPDIPGVECLTRGENNNKPRGRPAVYSGSALADPAIVSPHTPTIFKIKLSEGDQNV